jgi:DNA-binding NarL/FixJ family response regulator
MLTILIVDDHRGFRTQVRALLEADGFDVVGEAADGAGAIEAVRVLRPSLVLLDIGLPDREGFDVARELVDAPAPGDHGRPPRVVLTSSRDAAAYGPRIARSGAVGFIPKDELSGAAIQALLRAS